MKYEIEFQKIYADSLWCLDLFPPLSHLVSLMIACSCSNRDREGDSDHHCSEKMIEDEDSALKIENFFLFKTDVEANREVLTPDHILTQLWDGEELTETEVTEIAEVANDTNIKESSDIIRQRERWLSAL